jgi:lipopolysaccharide/colanic/teichoic acid biosynthesis glycosyltransferase
LFRRKATTFDKFLKRLFDILVGLPMLILLLPFQALVALIIKLDSKGPTFVLQKRLGKDGKTFNLVKFRTMVTNADEILEEHFQKFPHLREEWENTYKLKNDPRITKVGRFLRRGSMDELPQIYNVIKGEMSIVGPRPLLYSRLESYSSNYIEIYKKMRPGITGLWQVSNITNSLDEQIKLDEYYINNWYLWMDIKILFKTIYVSFSQQGAY